MRFQTQAIISLTLPTNAGPGQSRIVLNGATDLIQFYQNSTLVGQLGPGAFEVGGDLNDITKSYVKMAADTSSPAIIQLRPNHVGNVADGFILADFASSPVMTIQSPITSGFNGATIAMTAANATVPKSQMFLTADHNYSNNAEILAGRAATGIASADVNPIPSAAATAVPGCSLSFSPANSNASILVWGVFDIETTVAVGAGFSVGQCFLNGVVQAGQAIQTLTILARSTVAMQWQIDGLTSAGAPYTVDLRVQKSVAGGTSICHSNQTKITALHLDHN